VFAVTPKGTEAVVYSFGGYSGDGLQPYSGVVPDKAGNLYGTTWHGGAYNYGTVFKVTPKGVETVLYSFTGQSDGANPLGGMFLDKSGNLYGTTQKGGAYGGGTVYRVTP
jgi:uncharacterized repeat protein (TIGR03803 family)